MNRKLQVFKYVFADYVSAALAWSVLFIFRKKVLEPKKFGYELELEFGEVFYMGLALIPILWITLYAIAGYYKRIYRKHRLKELGQTLLYSVIGVIILFFTFLLDDEIASYHNYYQSILVLFTAHFGFTFLFRFILTSITVRRVHKGKLGFNTIIVGGNERALEMYDEIAGMRKSPGFRFVGYVKVNGSDNVMCKHMQCLGSYNDLPALIEKLNIEEVIIAIESSDHKYLQEILNLLEGTGVFVKIIPDMYDILSGSVKMSSIFGAPLIQINREIMPAWQFSLKRIFDFVGSAFAMIVLSPLFITLALFVKLTSKGSVFFVQERIGLHGKPFNIIKFRTMVMDAEKQGPQLSSTSDPRITNVGRFLRKTRLDELPQFLNVLKGDMSLVGPRPEREFFIERIMEQAPHYRHLHKVRPGITSWGQVKYGYAENVEQMIQRLKYDVIYIENMSFAVDIKILAYTILIVLKGSGK